MRIRYFLIVAGMLLLALWARPDWRLPPGYDYSAIVGDLFLGAFVVVFIWREGVERVWGEDGGAEGAAEEASGGARFEWLRRAADAAGGGLAQRESQAQRPAEPRV